VACQENAERRLRRSVSIDASGPLSAWANCARFTRPSGGPGDQNGVPRPPSVTTPAGPQRSISVFADALLGLPAGRRRLPFTM